MRLWSCLWRLDAVDCCLCVQLLLSLLLPPPLLLLCMAVLLMVLLTIKCNHRSLRYTFSPFVGFACLPHALASRSTIWWDGGHETGNFLELIRVDDFHIWGPPVSTFLISWTPLSTRMLVPPFYCLHATTVPEYTPK